MWPLGELSPSDARALRVVFTGKTLLSVSLSTSQGVSRQLGASSLKFLCVAPFCLFMFLKVMVRSL